MRRTYDILYKDWAEAFLEWEIQPDELLAARFERAEITGLYRDEKGRLDKFVGKKAMELEFRVDLDELRKAALRSAEYPDLIGLWDQRDCFWPTEDLSR